MGELIRGEKMGIGKHFRQLAPQTLTTNKRSVVDILLSSNEWLLVHKYNYFTWYYVLQRKISSYKNIKKVRKTEILGA